MVEQFMLNITQSHSNQFALLRKVSYGYLIQISAWHGLFYDSTVDQWFPTFFTCTVYGGTLLSYLNFRGTSIILVNNKKFFTENMSMISQFSSQNYGDL